MVASSNFYRLLTLCLFFNLICTFFCNAQFTYFSQLNGVVGEFAENNTNVEVIGESFYVCGPEVYQDSRWYFREYDFDGNLINQKYYDFEYEHIWLGSTTTFNKLEDESGFVLAQEKWDTLNHWSYLMRFDLDLDTLWTKKYSYDIGYSSFDTSAEVDDGFVLVGRYNTEFVLGADQGTFIQKVNTSGELIWSNILNPIQDGLTFFNKSIIEVDNKFIVGGIRDSTVGNEINFKGYIEVIDQFGNTTSVIESDDNGLSSQWYYILKLSNGDILCSNMVAYEESDDGRFFYKTKLYKLDMETNILYWEHEYLGEENFIGAPLVPKETPDGGLILMGNRKEEESNKEFTSLLKINETGEQEWYKEYAYLECDSCINHILDFEIASDGGYILAGYFLYDVGLPHYRESWLLKLDACGDVEWVECDPLLINENIETQNTFVLYPNPTSGELYLAGAIESVIDVEIYNELGSLVGKEKIIPFQGLIQLPILSAGTYSVIFRNDKRILQVSNFEVLN